MNDWTKKEANNFKDAVLDYLDNSPDGSDSKSPVVKEPSGKIELDKNRLIGLGRRCGAIEKDIEVRAKMVLFHEAYSKGWNARGEAIEKDVDDILKKTNNNPEYRKDMNNLFYRYRNMKPYQFNCIIDGYKFCLGNIKRILNGEGK